MCENVRNGHIEPHTPEAPCQVTNTWIQNCVCKKICTPRDEFALQIPAMHASPLSPSHAGFRCRAVTRPSHDVEVMGLLQSAGVLGVSYLFNERRLPTE